MRGFALFESLMGLAIVNFFCGDAVSRGLDHVVITCEVRVTLIERATRKKSFAWAECNSF